MGKPNGSVRVLIADDHPAMREGLCALLEGAPDIEIVGEARDGVETQRMVAALRPDVLLLDLVMPGLRPCQVEKWVRVNCPDTVTLVLTAHDRDLYLADMVEAGAAGFMSKNQSPERLLQAIRRVGQGEILFSQEQLARAQRWRETVGRRWESLTERERQVLHELADGLDNAAIAEALGVTPKTVAYHVTNLLRKLEVASRLEAAVWFHKHWSDRLRDDLEEFPG